MIDTRNTRPIHQETQKNVATHRLGSWHTEEQAAFHAAFRFIFPTHKAHLFARLLVAAPRRHSIAATTIEKLRKSRERARYIYLCTFVPKQRYGRNIRQWPLLCIQVHGNQSSRCEPQSGRAAASIAVLQPRRICSSAHYDSGNCFL